MSNSINNNYLTTAKKFSQKKIKELRKSLQAELGEKDFCIVIVGSYARHEASESSDLDYFLLTKDGVNISHEDQKAIRDTVQTNIVKQTGSTSTFGENAVVTINELTQNIGGVDDDNKKFTRRMLFLLESQCLYSDILFNKFKKQLVETYIKESVLEHKSSKFFLNDIIRFYRTMATDFEYKTSERKQEPKVRNIKLTFSRKLLYFSGIIVVAETVQKTRVDKIEETLELLKKYPLERIKYIFGDRANKVFEFYDYFLGKISDKDIRVELEKTSIPKDGEFRRLKNQSKHFSWALSAMLDEFYGSSHPIHHDLIF